MHHENRRCAVAVVVCVVGGVSTQAVAQDLLFNGNLDQTYAQVIVDNAPAGPGPEDFRLPKPLGWVNEGTRTLTGAFEDELSSEPWAGPTPTPVTTDGTPLPHPDGPGGPDAGVFFRPFTGNVSNGPATGHLYQDVAATPGLMYELTGWAGAEANAMMAGAEIALEFLDAGGDLIPGSGQVVDLMPTLWIDNGESFDYKQYLATATAPAGAEWARARVSMLGALANPAGGGQAFVVDDFALTIVPEPAALSLLLAGGLAALRRPRMRPRMG